MPSFTHQCDCGLRFEIHIAFKNKDLGVPCNACGAKDTLRLLPNGVRSGLDIGIVGSGPQSTGTSLDHDTDRVVGIAAELGWAHQEKRVADKRATLSANPGQDPRDMTQNPDGSWGFLPQGKGNKLQHLSSEIAKNAPSDSVVPNDPTAKREPGVRRPQ